MGANCCAAAQNTSLPGTNLNQSPPWSFRWDHRTRVEDHSQHSHRRKGNTDSKLATRSSPCPLTASQAQQLHRSPINIRVSWKFREDVGELSSSQSSRMRQSIPVSPDRQECKICSVLLTKKSSWSFHKEAPTKGPCVVAVLFCGHVYHAECLEKLTPETDTYDPPCPVCIHGKHFNNSRLVGNAKSGASGKISKIVSVDNNGVDGDMISEYQRSPVKVRGIGLNSSMKGSFRKHFMGHL